MYVPSNGALVCVVRLNRSDPIVENCFCTLWYVRKLRMLYMWWERGRGKKRELRLTLQHFVLLLRARRAAHP